RGGQILVDEGGRTAQRFVEVPEQSLAHPFALDPGVEGGLVAQADLYQALAGRVARHDQPDGGARIDDHPPAAGGNGEGRFHALDALLGKALVGEGVDESPAARRRGSFLEPLEIRVRQAETRPLLLEVRSRTEEAAAELRGGALDGLAVRVLPVIDPPPVLDVGPVALASHAAEGSEALRGLQAASGRRHALPSPPRGSSPVGSAPRLVASRFRKRPTSVTMPVDSTEPRSASLVTTAGLMSTQMSRTPAGVMFPTPIEWSMEESMRIMSAPSISRAYSACAATRSTIVSGSGPSSRIEPASSTRRSLEASAVMNPKVSPARGTCVGSVRTPSTPHTTRSPRPSSRIRRQVTRGSPGAPSTTSTASIRCRAARTHRPRTRTSV